MSNDFVLYLLRQTLEVAMMLSAPVLVVTLVVGFVTGLLQAVTSLRDQTMGLVIKLAAVGLTLIIFGNWMIELTLRFTREIFNHMQMVGQ